MVGRPRRGGKQKKSAWVFLPRRRTRPDPAAWPASAVALLLEIGRFAAYDGSAAPSARPRAWGGGLRHEGTTGPPAGGAFLARLPDDAGDDARRLHRGRPHPHARPGQ